MVNENEKMKLEMKLEKEEKERLDEMLERSGRRTDSEGIEYWCELQGCTKYRRNGISSSYFT